MFEYRGIDFVVKGGAIGPSFMFSPKRPANTVRLFNSSKRVVWVNGFNEDGNHHIFELRAPDGGGFSRAEAEILACEMSLFSRRRKFITFVPFLKVSPPHIRVDPVRGPIEQDEIYPTV
jgi:hypothetical protein